VTFPRVFRLYIPLILAAHFYAGHNPRLPCCPRSIRRRKLYPVLCDRFCHDPASYHLENHPNKCPQKTRQLDVPCHAYDLNPNFLRRSIRLSKSTYRCRLALATYVVHNKHLRCHRGVYQLLKTYLQQNILDKSSFLYCLVTFQVLKTYHS